MASQIVVLPRTLLGFAIGTPPSVSFFVCAGPE
jgi:hypothetical protein